MLQHYKRAIGEYPIRERQCNPMGATRCYNPRGHPMRNTLRVQSAGGTPWVQPADAPDGCNLWEAPHGCTPREAPCACTLRVHPKESSRGCNSREAPHECTPRVQPAEAYCRYSRQDTPQAQPHGSNLILCMHQIP